MATFTVRVELHHASRLDYEQLQAAMEEKGFSREITSDDGRRFQMPWAEYNGTGNIASARVREVAQEAADSTGKHSAILVTEAVSRVWSGLTAA